MRSLLYKQFEQNDVYLIDLSDIDKDIYAVVRRIGGICIGLAIFIVRGLVSDFGG